MMFLICLICDFVKKRQNSYNISTWNNYRKDTTKLTSIKIVYTSVIKQYNECINCDSYPRLDGLWRDSHEKRSNHLNVIWGNFRGGIFAPRAVIHSSGNFSESCEASLRSSTTAWHSQSMRRKWVSFRNLLGPKIGQRFKQACEFSLKRYILRSSTVLSKQIILIC